MLTILYVRCHSYFSCDFMLSSDYVFADDLWSVMTQFSLRLPCINDESVLPNDFICETCISICCRFHPSVVTQFSKMISRSTMIQLWVTISGPAVAWCFGQFHALAMNLFLAIDLTCRRAVDSTREVSLIFKF